MKKNKINKKTKVFVALSGGVDSSVALALLKNKGFKVTGVYMKNWAYEDFQGVRCPWREDLDYARKVCQRLKVPFKIYNFQKEYKKKVVDYLIESYRKGITPNPDIMCNKFIKFGLFLKKAQKEGAHLIATGHHVRKKKTEEGFILLKGKDKQKDQSYFLYVLTQSQLKYSLFPIGDYTKKEVRELAKKFKLPTWQRKDSQGICFLGQVDLPQFLKAFLKEKEGEILNTEGKVIGHHPGYQFFTIGQRAPLGGQGPFYIVRINPKKNQLIVTNNPQDKALYQKELIAGKVNWILPSKIKFPLKCKAKIRYRTKEALCVVNKEKRGIRVKFFRPQRAITPGQAIVFYQGKTMLGGGIIKRVT
jgi:tRNA-specific 2-thiouridylase